MSKIIILGINWEQNSSASLMIDGKIVSGISEERFTRKKNDESYPKNAIEYVLKTNNINANQITKICFISKYWSPTYSLIRHYTNFSVEDYKKSLDIKDFDLSFVRGLSFEDGLSTITNFTGYLIAKGIEYLNYKNKNVKFLISGGGRKNKFLIECIKNNIIDKKNIILENVEKYNLDGDYIESQAFGYLAIRSFLKLPISFPKTTRCDSPVVGGILAKNY